VYCQGDRERKMAGAVPLAGMGMVADPREGEAAVAYTTGDYRPLRSLHDNSVTLEEYMYQAKITRAEEDRLFGPESGYVAAAGNVQGFVLDKIRGKKTTVVNNQRRLSLPEAILGQPPSDGEKDKKHDSSAVAGSNDRWEVTEAEWVNASRAARTATWGAVFYLITTDILGPYTVGWAFTQLGWGPGVALYTIFGVLAGYTGLQLWRMFLELDSDRFPMKDYGDFAFRIFGSWVRHLFNFLQSFQYFFNVGIIIITNGQSLSQMSTGKLCFVVCCVVSAIAGCIVGQIRTLARFGWLASLAVFMNLFVIFATMGVFATSPPNYVAVAASFPAVLPDVNNPSPKHTTAGSPPGLSFLNNVNGLMQAVFSYGGATLFPNLLAEMRRPWDFWKGMICAEVFIYLCYLIYGCVNYGLQGQYAYNPSYQGVSVYAWQTVFNSFGLITGLIAACLYGNIGIKVLYNSIGRDLLRAPLLETKKGKLLWALIVPVYWILAFVVAAAIPQVALFSSFVAASCILQFTYTFPPMLMVGFKVQRDAILPGETFDPATGVVQRQDSGIRRWIRGYRKEFWLNTWDVIFFLGSVVTAVLGIYSSISSMHTAYVTNPNVAAFSCNSPVNG